MNTLVSSPHRTVRVSQVILALSGLIAAAIAVTILFAPGAFYTGYGLEVAGNPTLSNELKAPAAGLLLASFVMMAGLFRQDLIKLSLATAAGVYLAYGVGRVLSIALDGLPHSGMVSAAIIELAVGSVCLAALAVFRRGARHES